MWSPELAYAIGLLATDGSLSNDGRHINLTSKDEDQLKTFLSCIDRPDVPISRKRGGFHKDTAQVQFSDVTLYDFCLVVGLTPNKTKTISALAIPDEFFFDFLRGHHDGDGCFYSYLDPRWKSSFMFYLAFISASGAHIDWIQSNVERLVGARGHITVSSRSCVVQLKYAKADSLKLLRRLYPNSSVPHLARKRLKIVRALRIIRESLPA